MPEWVTLGNLASAVFNGFGSLVLTFMKNLIDIKTKQSTAFYAALAVVCWDAWKRGFNPYNALILASLAGLGTLGALAAIFGLGTSDPPKPDKPKP